MVVILLIFGKLTTNKAAFYLDSHDLKFGREVLLLFVVFHKHLCFKLIICNLKPQQLLYGGYIQKESVELIPVYLLEGCGKT